MKDINKTAALLLAMLVFGVVALIGPWCPAQATWDVTTPAGTEAKSLGDNRIREFKTDVQAALVADGVFPGTDTANPVYYHTPPFGNTANRPSNHLYTGRTYLDTQVHSFMIYNGGWATVDLVPNNSVDEFKLTSSVAGNGLGGGNGSDLAVQVDNSTLELSSDQVREKDGGTTYAKIAPFSKMAVSTTGINDVTGDGTVYQMKFGTKDFDINSEYSTTTGMYVPGTTGKYQFNVCLGLSSPVGGGANASMSLVVNGSSFTVTNAMAANTSTSLCESIMTSMTAGTSSFVTVTLFGGAKTSDITNSYFSGHLLP